MMSFISRNTNFIFWSLFIFWLSVTVVWKYSTHDLPQFRAHCQSCWRCVIFCSNVFQLMLQISIEMTSASTKLYLYMFTLMNLLQSIMLLMCFHAIRGETTKSFSIHLKTIIWNKLIKCTCHVLPWRRLENKIRIFF